MGLCKTWFRKQNEMLGSVRALSRSLNRSEQKGGVFFFVLNVNCLRQMFLGKDSSPAYFGDFF